MTAVDLMMMVIAVPFVCSLLLPLADRIPNVREAITLLASVVLLYAAVFLLDRFFDGERPSLSVFEVVPGLTIEFSLEPLGMLFILIASTLWIVNSIYSIGYMRANDEPRQTSFYVCFAVAIGSTMCIALAANLFTLFLFYELLTLSTYPLVAHKANEQAVIGARTYLLVLLATSMVLFLPAIIWTWDLTGTLAFKEGGIFAGNEKFSAADNGIIIGVLLALFVFGIGKAALMPFHFWLPAAMVAPTPVSALLHAVAVVKAGVFCIVKVIVYIFGVDFLRESGQGDWLLYAAGFTVIVASFVALRQDNLKRRLAYSTVSQLSYVVLAAALLTPLSIVAAAMHIAAHAVSKITLFFAAGSIYTASRCTEVSQIGGIGRRMPWTMAAFAVGAISMIGVPPTAGFLGKWFMVMEGMNTAHWFAVGVIILSTVLNAAYFLPIVYTAFFRPLDPTLVDVAEAPWPIVAALSATALGTLVLFFVPGLPFSLANLLVGR